MRAMSAAALLERRSVSSSRSAQGAAGHLGKTARHGVENADDHEFIVADIDGAGIDACDLLVPAAGGDVGKAAQIGLIRLPGPKIARPGNNRPQQLGQRSKSNGRTVRKPARRRSSGGFALCAEHDRQLGGESPLSSLMAAKD
jgi:hypothetical protein